MIMTIAEYFTFIIPAANTAMSLSLAALTRHVDPCFMQ